MNKQIIQILEYKKNFSVVDKNKLNFNLNRLALIFFLILILFTIYTTRIVFLASKTLSNQNNVNSEIFRADIVDRNGNFISKSVYTNNVGIDPNLVKDKKKLLIKLKYSFPNKDFYEIEEKLNGKSFFYIEKNLTPDEYNKFKLLGEKSIRLEPRITRLYPDRNLFSHVSGQIDDNNNGISGLEKTFDQKLKTEKENLILTLDKELQFIIRNELKKSEKIFQVTGAGAILMNINNGEVLSLTSIPDYDLNKRQNLSQKIYINRVTKGVYELGSVFKSFTLAAALNLNLLNPDEIFYNLEKKMKCGNRIISEYDEELPKNLSVEQILIKSGNIGSVKIGQLIGKDNLKNFLKKIGVLDRIKFDIEEVGTPLPFKWGECKLKTVSYGHGITTTPLQLAKAYSILSNGGYEIEPTLIKKNYYIKGNKLLDHNVSNQINKILRKVVVEGTATLADVKGYEVGGKTGTAQIVENGIYTKKKINTFASVFPMSDPKFVLIVLLEDTKLSKDYIYEYRDGKGSFSGTPFNTAGWTAVEIAGKMIDKIGPILATKY
ncbi:MAG: penicillin-binding protein 2 [Pseudomonadota bacterium]|nr:penicillin-binding protein 2 [Pseudomonadota bacterium]